VPTGPKAGNSPLMTGTGSTVKLLPLLDTPATTTTTLPVVAPVGTSATMFALFQLTAVATFPLNFTALDPCVTPKLFPVIVTALPIVPNVGERLVMLGEPVTVKSIWLLATPDTLTTTLPVVAPDGTRTTIAPVLQLVGVAGVPLNTIVLDP
jgi:hypothetical protein